MHATIAAFSCGVPVVPLVYSRKYVGVRGELGYEKFVDLRAECNAVVMDLIEDSVHRREKVAKDVAKTRENVGFMLDAHRDLSTKIILDILR